MAYQSTSSPTPVLFDSPSAKLAQRVGTDLGSSLDLYVGTFGGRAPDNLAIQLSYVLTDSEVLQLIESLKRVKGLR